jgi:hypothetical protein
VIRLGQRVKARYLLARQQLPIRDLLAQVSRDPQIGRHQLSGHKINILITPAALQAGVSLSANTANPVS